MRSRVTSTDSCFREESRRKPRLQESVATSGLKHTQAQDRYRILAAARDPMVHTNASQGMPAAVQSRNESDANQGTVLLPAAEATDSQRHSLDNNENKVT